MADPNPYNEGVSSNEDFETGESNDSVFTKFVKTLTNQNGYQDDGADKPLLRLRAMAYASNTSMDEVPEGYIQQHIKGDTAQVYEGNRLIIVNQNDELRVKGTQKETVKGNAQHMYLSNFLRGVTATDDVRVTGERHIIVIGQSSEDYASKHEINAPEEFEWKSLESGLSVLKLDFSGMSLDVHAHEVGVHQYDMEFAGVKTGGFEGYETFAEQRAHFAALLDRIGGSLDVLFEVNASPSMGFDLPF